MLGAFASRKANQRLFASRKQSALQQAMNQALLSPGQRMANQLQQQAALGALNQLQLAKQQTGGGTTTIISNPYITASSSTTTGTNWYTTSGTPTITTVASDYLAHAGIQIRDGQACVIDLPDGSKLDVKADGSYEVIDKDAKITYRANRLRDFNAYLNASDKLEEFIRFCGEHRVDKDDMMGMPVRLFIAWLVQEAAKQDQEPDPPDVHLIPDLRARLSPRCTGCGRFLRRQLVKKKVEFCAPVCFDRHYQRQLEAA